MSKTILSVQSSVFGGAGVSAELSQELIDRFRTIEADLTVIERDLVKDELPYYGGDYLQALALDEHSRSDLDREKVAIGDRVIAEVKSADILVLAAPMYNFGVPAVLKTWFDYLARAGDTFKYTEEGPKGLLKNKAAFVITTRGGQHKGLPSDSQTAFIKTYLNFIGIEEIQFIYAEGLNMAARDVGIAGAKVQIEAAGLHVSLGLNSETNARSASRLGE